MRGDSTVGGATLNITGNATITAGHFQLQANSNYSAILTVGGTLSIGSAGHFDVLYPSDDNIGFNSILGTVNNAGVVTLGVTTVFNAAITNSGNWTIGRPLNNTAAHAVTDANFNQSAGTLFLNDNTSLDIIGSTFNYTGGIIQHSESINPDGSIPSGGGTIALDNASLATSIADGQGAIFSSIGNLSLTTDFASNTSLYVFASGTLGGSALNLSNIATSNGLIVFRVNDGYGAQITAGTGAGIFTNRGTLVTTDNNGDGNFAMNAAFVNFGTVNAFTNIALNNNVANEAQFNLGEGYTISINNARFNQDAGALGNSGDTHFVVNNGTFNFNGGQIFLTVDLFQSTLGINVADGKGVAFNAYQGLLLTSDIPPNTTLFSIANGVQGGTILAVQPNASNFGNLTLRADNDYPNAIQAGDGTANFNNRGTLSILRNSGSGTFTMIGTFVNFGTLFMNADTVLLQNASNENQFNIASNVTLSMSNARFNQDAGNLGNDGNTHFVIHDGGFNLNGGQVFLTVDLFSSFLSTSVPNAFGVAFNVFTAGTLNGNLSPGANVFVVANGVIGGSQFNVQNNASNNGFIKLTALNGYSIDFVIGDGTGTFHNPGILNFAADAISPNIIDGNLDNAGSLFVNGHALFNGNITNTGSFTIQKGATAELAANRTLFQSGILEVDGTLTLDNGRQNRPFRRLHP